MMLAYAVVTLATVDVLLLVGLTLWALR